MSIAPGAMEQMKSSDSKGFRPSSSDRYDDNEAIQSNGEIEELRKDFSVWSLGALCLALMATWEAVTSVVAAALTNGGAPCLFYN